MTTVRTNVHSYKVYNILDLIWNKASYFTHEAKIARATPEMAELLKIAPWPAVMRFVYLDDMTIAIKYELQSGQVLPPSVVKGAAAAVIITTAMLEYEHENLWRTVHKTSRMNLADLANLAATQHECISPWNQRILIDDILLATTLITDADVSSWPSDKVKAFAGRELNPIEFEFATNICNCLDDIDNKKLQKMDKLDAVYNRAMEMLAERARNEKRELHEKVASLLSDNLVDASISGMLSVLKLNHAYSS